MSLTVAEVRHIAELARLAISDDEVELYRDQLAQILQYAEILGTVDTSSVEPTATVLPLHNVMRDDEIEPSLEPQDVLANAPDAHDGYFRVGAILEPEG